MEFPTATPVITFHLTPRSAEYWRRWTSQLGALVCGRTLFDFTDALVAVHLGVGLVELRKDPDPFRVVAWSGEARRDCAEQPVPTVAEVEDAAEAAARKVHAKRACWKVPLGGYL